jgi:hypothetical protein
MNQMSWIEQGEINWWKTSMSRGELFEMKLLAKKMKRRKCLKMEEHSFNQDGWSLSNCHNQHYRLSLGFLD